MGQFVNEMVRLFHPNRIKSIFLHFALKGNTVECVCCGSKYISFLPAGLTLRPNAKCIHCGSLERHRVVWMFLLQQTDIFNKAIRLLHVAPERQFYKKFIVSKNIDYYPIDLQPDKYNYGSAVNAMDLTQLKYPDEYFDAVICNHVLEHVPDDQKAMSEIYRVLKKNGWAILNVPVDTKRSKTFEDFSVTDPLKRIEMFGQQDHVRVYGSDYLARLQNAGFHTRVIDFVSGFSHNEKFRYGFQANELIYFCSK